MKKAVTLVVRRGALRRFDRLKKDAAALPVDIIWDRRQAKATSPTDEEDRRRTPPFTWDVADFVAVEKRPQQRKATKKG